MRVGDLVKWDDPGKDAIGIVICVPEIPYSIAHSAFNTMRIEVSWFSGSKMRISRPKLMEIKLVEPRKFNESR